MLNGRLYSAAFVPFLIALEDSGVLARLAAAAADLDARPEAFEGSQAFSELRSLAASYPDRRPGSAGDDALAAHIAATIAGIGGTGGAGFTVRTVQVEGQTIEGGRILRTVIAERPGSATRRRYSSSRTATGAARFVGRTFRYGRPHRLARFSTREPSARSSSSRPAAERRLRRRRAARTALPCTGPLDAGDGTR